MPIGTAFHERTFALCESLSYREWSGYYAVSVYETHHEHEYNAIRNAAALIDITPLFKYRVTGRDATKFVNRVIARDIHKVAVGQVIYCGKCLPLDRRRSEPAMVPAKRAGTGCLHRRYLRGGGGPGRARADFGKRAS